MIDKKINKTEENAFIKEFKQNCRSLVAVSYLDSTFFILVVFFF